MIEILHVTFGCISSQTDNPASNKTGQTVMVPRGTGMSGSALNLVRLAPDGTNVGLFKISFSTFWLGEPKCTDTDLKQSQICPIWSQSDPICKRNLTYVHPSYW